MTEPETTTPVVNDEVEKGKAKTEETKAEAAPATSTISADETVPAAGEAEDAEDEQEEMEEDALDFNEEDAEARIMDQMLFEEDGDFNHMLEEIEEGGADVLDEEGEEGEEGEEDVAEPEAKKQKTEE